MAFYALQLQIVSFIGCDHCLIVHISVVWLTCAVLFAFISWFCIIQFTAFIITYCVLWFLSSAKRQCLCRFETCDFNSLKWKFELNITWILFYFNFWVWEHCSSDWHLCAEIIWDWLCVESTWLSVCHMSRIGSDVGLPRHSVRNGDLAICPGAQHC